MVDEGISSPTLEITISAKVIFELAKSFDIMYATATSTYVREGFPTTLEPPLCDQSNYGGPLVTWR
jgi:hypothetical protein